MPDEKLYKVLIDGQSCHGGSLQWSLPRKIGRKWQPGAWHTVKGEPSLCSRGLHLTTDYTQWLKAGCTIFLAEGRGRQSGPKGDKIAFEEARLLRPVAVPAWWRRVDKFVATLKDVPWGMQHEKPLDSWRLFTAGDLNAAVNAAVNAARDAAWNAAVNAAVAAARKAAMDAVRDAVRDAAWNAAVAAARKAALDAARDAARKAAMDAARDAARKAAMDAARDAAWDAAVNAGWECQVNHLCADLAIARKHGKAMADRWEVYRRGWWLYAEVGGVLYVYGKE